MFKKRVWGQRRSLEYQERNDLKMAAASKEIVGLSRMEGFEESCVIKEIAGVSRAERFEEGCVVERYRGSVKSERI